MTAEMPLLTLVNKAAQMRQGIKDVLIVLETETYPDMDMVTTMLKGLVEDGCRPETGDESDE